MSVTLVLVTFQERGVRKWDRTRSGIRCWALTSRDVPPTGDRVSVVAEGCREALGEGLALPPELPLAVADAHLVDAADAALVGVELEVRSVSRIASDDGVVVGRLRKLGR